MAIFFDGCRLGQKLLIFNHGRVWNDTVLLAHHFAEQCIVLPEFTSKYFAAKLLSSHRRQANSLPLYHSHRFAFISSKATWRWISWRYNFVYNFVASANDCRSNSLLRITAMHVRKTLERITLGCVCSQMR